MNKTTIILIACTLVTFCIGMRLAPHAPNLTPVTAVAFVASLYLGRKWGIVLPLFALFLSDLIIGFYDWRIAGSVYGSFAVIGILSVLAATYRNVLSAGLALVASPFLFFLITNAAVWAFSPWYAKTLSGLLYAYELGLPFLRNMLIGDILYTAALIFVFEAIRNVYERRHELQGARHTVMPPALIHLRLH